MSPSPTIPASDGVEGQKLERSVVVHEWLAKSLCAPWTSPAVIAPETSRAVLEVVAERWHLFDTTLKVRLLCTMLVLRQSKLQELSYDLRKIITLAKKDGDEWVSMIAKLLQDYPASGCLQLQPMLEGPKLQESCAHIAGLLKAHPSDLYPREIAYMEESAIRDCYGDVMAGGVARNGTPHCSFKDGTEAYDSERRKVLQVLASATVGHMCVGRPGMPSLPAAGGSIFVKKKSSASFLRSGSQRPTGITSTNRGPGSGRASHAAGGPAGPRQSGGAYQKSSRIQMLDLDAGRNIIQAQNETAAAQQAQIQQEKELRKIKAREAMEEKRLQRDKERELKKQQRVEKEKQKKEAREERRKRALEEKTKATITQKEVVTNNKKLCSDEPVAANANNGSQLQRDGIVPRPKLSPLIVIPSNAMSPSASFLGSVPHPGALLHQPEAPSPQPTPGISPLPAAVDLNSLFQQCNVLADHDRSFIIGFLNGQQLRPPNLAQPLCQIVLNEERYRDNDNTERLEQIVFEMNFDNREWKKLRRRVRVPLKAPCQQQNIPLPTSTA